MDGLRDQREIFLSAVFASASVDDSFHFDGRKMLAEKKKRSFVSRPSSSLCSHMLFSTKG